MVARASRADLPKTLWKQEREGKVQKDGRRAGDNERERYSGVWGLAVAEVGAWLGSVSGVWVRFWDRVVLWPKNERSQRLCRTKDIFPYLRWWQEQGLRAGLV